MKYDIPYMTTEAVSLLKSLISIPSISREETQAADFLQNYIEMAGMQTGRKGNNVWCFSPMFDLKKPTILLNSHMAPQLYSCQSGNAFVGSKNEADSQSCHAGRKTCFVL